MSRKSKKPTSKFIAMWDCNGLEYVSDISHYEHWDQEQLLNIITGGREVPNPINKQLGFMKMRAMANPQRFYEIYAFSSDSDVTESAVREMFATCPQAMVDLIRAKGVAVYSNRRTQQPVIV